MGLKNSGHKTVVYKRFVQTRICFCFWWKSISLWGVDSALILSHSHQREQQRVPGSLLWAGCRSGGETRERRCSEISAVLTQISQRIIILEIYGSYSGRWTPRIPGGISKVIPNPYSHWLWPVMVILELLFSKMFRYEGKHPWSQELKPNNKHTHCLLEGENVLSQES